MPLSLPSALEYGKVTARVVLAAGDSADDVDSHPDALSIAAYVNFYPSKRSLFVSGGSDPGIVKLGKVTAALDSSGVLRDSEGRVGVELIATDGTWHWLAHFDVRTPGIGGLPDIPFYLEPDEVLDLTSNEPVDIITENSLLLRGPKGDTGPAGPTGPQGPPGADGTGGGLTTEEVEDAAAGLLTSGTHSGISFAYDDTGRKVNATVTGGSGSYTDEQARDAIAAAFAAGTHTGITINVNDAANTISLSVVAYDSIISRIEALEATVEAANLALIAVNAVQTTGDVRIDETWDFTNMPTVGGEAIQNGFTLTQDATGVYLNVPSGG